MTPKTGSSFSASSRTLPNSSTTAVGIAPARPKESAIGTSVPPSSSFIPAAQGQKAYEVLAPLLGARVAYRAFDALGHGISEDSLIEAARWLTARLDDGAKALGNRDSS